MRKIGSVCVRERESERQREREIGGFCNKKLVVMSYVRIPGELYI